MGEIEGHYRHDHVAVRWDGGAVEVVANDLRVSTRWNDVEGARRLGELPGSVQLIVRGHVPPSDPLLDAFSVPVASEADANRLLTTFSWLAHQRSA